MPKGKWSAKEERKYRHILKSCEVHSKGQKKGRGRKSSATCKRIAAATVNRDRALSALGLGNPLEAGLLASRPMRGLRGTPSHEQAERLVNELNRANEELAAAEAEYRQATDENLGWGTAADVTRLQHAVQRGAARRAGAVDEFNNAFGTRLTGLRGTPEEHDEAARAALRSVGWHLDHGKSAVALLEAGRAIAEASWTNDPHLIRQAEMAAARAGSRVVYGRAPVVEDREAGLQGLSGTPLEHARAAHTLVDAAEQAYRSGNVRGAAISSAGALQEASWVPSKWRSADDVTRARTMLDQSIDEMQGRRKPEFFGVDGIRRRR